MLPLSLRSGEFYSSVMNGNDPGVPRRLSAFEPRRDLMKTSNSSSGILKFFLIGCLVLVLLIPLFRIFFLVEEREMRQQGARSEISQTWGEPQLIAGPVLSIPYRRLLQNEKGDFFYRQETLQVLPEELSMDVEIDPQVRRRGLFEAVVYRAEVTLRGHHRLPDLLRFSIDPEEVRWEDARLTMGLGKLRGLDTSPDLVWRGKSLPLEAGHAEDALMGEALAATLDAPLPPEEDAPFELRLTLRGSNSVRLYPLGRESRATVRSSWRDPSFQGSFLPGAPQVSEEGFEAAWTVPHFARSVPQAFIAPLDSDSYQALSDAAFGVDLLLPVDFYQLVSRCTKYAILFIGLTFGTFLLFELLADLRIHPVQYLLVGAALCLFYLLLLALAEHSGFDLAYLTASIATIGLISGYSATVLRTRGRAVVLGGVLTGLYGLLYVLVQLQTYSLLVGTIVLFATLAIAMFLSRNIDWYALDGPRSGRVLEQPVG